MSIEEMIGFCEDQISEWHDAAPYWKVEIKAATAIIAALNAGQAMRLATNVKDTRKAYAAWDVATKEDV